MKFDSPLFDRIRVKPGENRRPRTDVPTCEWAGCQEKASHRAPKGRLREREYWRFCLDHVREYNHSYNYFAGMSDDAVSRYQKDAITGHRPTWKMGLGKRPDGADLHTGQEGAQDPFGMFRELGGNWRQNFENAKPASRTVRNAEQKALCALGLENDATATDIKAKFKLLVKRHHPDANGGDRACEDKLREIIQAYNYLKSAKLC
jgi:DnaJ domain